VNHTTSSSALSATAVISSIQNLLCRAGPYDAWTIGSAQDIVQARSARDTSSLWNDWLTDSEREARHVLEHFSRRGMMLDASSDETGTYVYIL